MEMTPLEANAILYEVTQGHPDANLILFAVFDESPGVCMDMIRTIYRKKKFGAVWVRMFREQQLSPARFMKYL